MPLEAWFGVFAPISRQQLANHLNEIGSQSFANIAMPFLHEYGQITLGKMSFGGEYGTHEMTAEAMPANIKDFESIEIWFDFIIYRKNLTKRFKFICQKLNNILILMLDLKYYKPFII